MYCKQCGFQLMKQVRFCPKCGEAIGGEEKVSLEEASATADQEHTAEDEKEFHFVRSNQKYYFNKWKKENSWNWVAFFFTPFWLGYRRMYKPILILLGIYLLFDIIVLFAFGSDADFFSNSSGIGAAIFFGLRGNDMYRNHMNRKISEIEAVTEPGSNRMRKIEAAGGTDGFGILYAFLLLVAYYILFVLLTGID